MIHRTGRKLLYRNLIRTINEVCQNLMHDRKTDDSSTVVHAGFVGCRFEQDATWNVSWPATEVDREAIQKCPGGSEAEGKVTTV